MQLRCKSLLILLLFVLATFASCTIERRHYRTGYYVDGWRNHSYDNSVVVSDKETADPDDTISPAEITKEDDYNYSAVEEDAESVPVVKPLPILPNEVAPAQKKNDRIKQSPKDEVPPDLDRPNKKIMWMIIAAVALVVIGVLFALLFPAIELLLLLIPVVGALLFLLAMIRRKKILQRVIAGETGDDVRLSKFFSRFVLALYCLFGSTIATFVGLALIGSAVSILGLILFQAGVVIGAFALLILLVLGLFWIFRWRKNGAGRKKPWEPRPKEG